jgi:hypothetical protein
MNALSRWVAKAKGPGAARQARAFSGKVESGFDPKIRPGEMPERLLFPIGVTPL